jgi:hypothetical protein
MATSGGVGGYLTGPSPGRPRLPVAWLWLALCAGQVGAAGTEPLLPLPQMDRLALDKSLGRGVVGKPVPAPVIADPAHYLSLAAGAWTYRLTKGAAGHREERYLWTSERGGVLPRWRYEAGSAEVGEVEGRDDGSFFVTGILEVRDRALTRYDPPEPLLFQGWAPGQERRLRMAVKVYDPDDLGEPVHEGALDVACQYVGAYRLEAPIGTYDAVLIKSTFSGKVGPASLHDVQYRFFAQGIGMLAHVERREVSAFYLYNLHQESAKLLAARPR